MRRISVSVLITCTVALPCRGFLLTLLLESHRPTANDRGYYTP